MTRYVRNTVIQAVLETTYAGTPGSWSGSAILISNASFKIERDVVPRELVRGYMGGSDQLVAARRATIAFEVELAGSGTAGTAPAWGHLLRACGMAETITAATAVEYTPVTTGQESVAIRYYIDGIYYVARGCRGNVEFMLDAYGIPKMKFSFNGFDTNAYTGPVPQNTFTDWVRPLVITDGNSGDLILGGTFNGSWAGGGTSLPSRGLSIDLGNTVSHLKLLGGEAVDITARETKGKMSVALSASDEKTWREDINDNKLTSLGFNFGTAAGNKFSLWAPKVQRIAPDIEDYEGRVLLSTELRLLPDEGNDELTLVVK